MLTCVYCVTWRPSRYAAALTVSLPSLAGASRVALELGRGATIKRVVGGA